MTEGDSKQHIPAARVVFSASDRQRILALIDASLTSGSLTLGPHTEAFEAAFRASHGAPFAVAVSSGTSALEIIFRCLRLEGAEVVLPTNTFFATAAAVVHAGGVPRFADVDVDTLGLSVATVAAALTPATAAVVLVHIGGIITPEIDAIRELCERRGVLLIEDAAHAHGCSYRNRPAGSFSRAAAFSFYATKVVTAGEGGMIVTSDERLDADARIYRDQGKAGFLGGDHVRMGSAWRMSELHAAVGLVSLERLDEAIAVRRQVAAVYDHGLADLEPLRPVVVPAGGVSNYYKYVALLEPGIDRHELKAELVARFGIHLSGEVYAKPLHHQPVFASLARGSWPVADDVCGRHVCLPMYSDMTVDEASRVTEGLRALLGERAERPARRAAPA